MFDLRKTISRNVPVTSFARCQSGASLILFAMMLPIVVFFAGAAIDYGRAASEKAELQAAIDASSLAAAKQLALISVTDDRQSIVQAVVESYLKSNLSGRDAGPHGVVAKIIDNPSAPLQVEVSAAKDIKSSFGSKLSFGNITVSASATATVVGKPNICLLALEPSGNGAIDLNHQAKGRRTKLCCILEFDPQCRN